MSDLGTRIMAAGLIYDGTAVETGYYDVRGIPICVGDLIRVKHFKHYRR